MYLGIRFLPPFFKQTWDKNHGFPPTSNSSTTESQVSKSPAPSASSSNSASLAAWYGIGFSIWLIRLLFGSKGSVVLLGRSFQGLVSPCLHDLKTVFCFKLPCKCVLFSEVSRGNPSQIMEASRWRTTYALPLGRLAPSCGSRTQVFLVGGFGESMEE